MRLSAWGNTCPMKKKFYITGLGHGSNNKVLLEQTRGPESGAPESTCGGMCLHPQCCRVRVRVGADWPARLNLWDSDHWENLSERKSGECNWSPCLPLAVGCEQTFHEFSDSEVIRKEARVLCEDCFLLMLASCRQEPTSPNDSLMKNTARTEEPHRSPGLRTLKRVSPHQF